MRDGDNRRHVHGSFLLYDGGDKIIGGVTFFPMHLLFGSLSVTKYKN